MLYESLIKTHVTSSCFPLTTMMKSVLLLSVPQCSPLHVLVFVSSASGPSRYCVPRNLSVFALSFFPHAKSVTAHCCSWFAPIWIQFYSTFSVFLVLLQHFSICWSFIRFFFECNLRDPDSGTNLVFFLFTWKKSNKTLSWIISRWVVFSFL